MKSLSLVLLILLAAGCASNTPIEEDLAASIAAASRTRAAPPRAVATVAVEENKRAEPVLIKGTDVMIGNPAARAAISTRGEAVSLRFEQAPVTEVIHAVLGDLLQADYAIVTPLEGVITLHTQTAVARAEVMPLLESVLQANGIALVADVAGRYRIGRADVLKSSSVPLPWRTDALPAGAGSVVVPLQYIGAVEMADILRPVAGQDALLRVDTVRNLLLLNGTRTQLDGWLEIIRTFDVDFLKGMSVGLFPLTYTSVREVDIGLRSLIGNAAVTTVRDPNAPAAPAGGAAAPAVGPQAGPGAAGRRAGGAAAAPAASAPNSDSVIGGPLAGLIRVMPIERLNALLIVTPRAHYLELAKSWIEKLDRPSDGDAEGQLYIYPVRNGSALHLADLLNSLYGGTSSTSSSSSGNTGVANNLSTSARMSGTMGRSTGGMSAGGGFGTLANTGSSTGGGATITQVDLGQNVRVVADAYNNALLIHASKRDYQRIEDALRRLDVAPAQVLIEASIVEVTLSDVLRYGLQWYFQDKLGNGWTGQGQLISNGVEMPGEGFGYAIVNPAGQIRAVLNALANKSLLNVLSNPNVMVLDNHTANIQVGDQQPVRSSTTITDGGSTINAIQYRDTGVMLSVTPTVNAGDMVTMEVEQSITDIGDVDVATGQRSFNQRQISSKVAVRAGETIVIGGLIRDNKTQGNAGIPLLHDLPIVGNLFGSTTVDVRRTELIIMLTPRVIRSSADVRQVGNELRTRLHGLRQLSGVAAEHFQRLALPAEDAGVVDDGEAAREAFRIPLEDGERAEEENPSASPPEPSTPSDDQ
jgi:general secretion pathway protein D